MKKITKLLVAVLTMALLVGTVFAFTVSADESQPAESSKGAWVISKNVSYSENIHLLLAIDANKVADESLLSVKITDKEGNVSEEFYSVEYKADLYGAQDAGAVPVYIIHTLGVAAKDMADELTIEILYNGNVVETTTYSVAEYFFERLYKNEVILAEEGADLDRKNLYFASLKYGNAAQKLLASSDALYIEDSLYVGGVPGVNAIFDPEELLTLSAGVYNVKSYVDGEFVESTVDQGDFFVEYPTVITKYEYKAPADAIKIDTAEDVDYGFAGAASKELGLANGAIKTTYYRQNSGATTLSVVQKNDADGDYLSINKSIAGGQQTWMNIVVDTAKTADLTTVVFEARMRLNISTYGSGYRFRFYSGSRTDNGGGTEFGDAGLAIRKGYEIGKYSGTSNYKSLGIVSNQWFTLRIVMSDYVEGEKNLQVYVLDETTSQFVSKWEGSIATLADVSTISCICIMDSSDTEYTNDIQYMYVGAEIPEFTAPQTETDSIYFKNDNASVANIYHKQGKNLLTNEMRYIGDKYNNDGQLVYRYVRTQNYTGTNNTTVFKAKVKLSNLPDLAWTTAEIDVSIGNESGTRKFQSYFSRANGMVTLKHHGQKGEYVSTGVALGEWFDLMIVYTAEGDSYDAAKFKVSFYINGKFFAETTDQWKSGEYVAGCDVGRVSFIANRQATLNVQLEGVSITTTNIPFASAE